MNQIAIILFLLFALVNVIMTIVINPIHPLTIPTIPPFVNLVLLLFFEYSDAPSSEYVSSGYLIHPEEFSSEYILMNIFL